MQQTIHFYEECFEITLDNNGDFTVKNYEFQETNEIYMSSLMALSHLHSNY